MKKFRIIRACLFAAIMTFGAAAPIISAPETAYAQSIRIQAHSSEIYAGMPFQLSVVVTDFDESPQPEIDPFTVKDADVQLLGVSPRVSSMTTIINGRRSTKKDVTFVFNYQITPKREGTYTLPTIVARQGIKTAASEQKLTFTARSVQTTVDMKIELQIPDRKLWVGETFEAKIAWYLRKDVSSQVFNLPILQMPEIFDVEEPDQAPQGWSIPMTVGSRQLAFPYTRDSVMVKGLEYTRFLISIRVTPLKSGAISLEPAKVLAELESGSRRDMWGLARSDYKLFKAEDVARTIEVRELPQSSRPATFSNAMGKDFDIQVTADRTIVKAGDPIILTIDISSPSSLEGLILPSLIEAGLNEQLFSVTNEDPIGENIEGAQGRNIKRFTVPVRIKSERVTEIPPIAFSYFNPSSEEFSTVRSQPIALSVTAVDKISAGDVFTGKINKPSDGEKRSGNSAAPKGTDETLIDPTAGALDLGLMVPENGFNAPMSDSTMRAIRISIYIAPFVIWLGLGMVRRSRRSRRANAPQREAGIALKNALREAETLGAREASSKISNALNVFLAATETPHEPFAELCERMDVEAYRPDAESLPLSKDLIDDFDKAVPKNVNEKYAKIIAGIFACMIALCMAWMPVSTAQAQEPAPQNVQVPSAVPQNVQVPSAVPQNVQVPSAVPQNVQVPSAAPQNVQVPSAAPQNVQAAEKTPAGASIEARYDAAAMTYHKALESKDRSERIALFKRSAAQFEAVAEEMPGIAAFYVNAGNAALGAVDFGSASLNYQRALVLAPDNEQAQTNLAYIRSVQNEAVGDDEGSLSAAFFLNKSLTPSQRLLVAAILFAIGILLLIPWNPKYRKVTGYIAILPLVFWVWMMAGYVFQPKSYDAVVMQETWLKTADNAGASNISTSPVEPGYSLYVLEERGDWVQVQLAGGQHGWMNRSAIEWIDSEMAESETAGE